MPMRRRLPQDIPASDATSDKNQPIADPYVQSAHAALDQKQPYVAAVRQAIRADLHLAGVYLCG